MRRHGMFLGVFGVALLALALLRFSFGMSILQGWVPTEGHVVSFVHVDSDGDDVYYPVVEFKPANGEKVQFRSRIGSAPPRYEVGERVDVRYSAGEPGDARICDTVSLWVFPCVLALSGGSLVALGAWLMKRGRRCPGPDRS